MARAAKKVTDIEGKAKERANRRTSQGRSKTRQSTLAGNTFEDLTAAQKDALLKELAVQAGLIDDSDDE